MLINKHTIFYYMEENNETDWTYIRLTKQTAEKLRQLGQKGETYEEIILRLIKN